VPRRLQRPGSNGRGTERASMKVLTKISGQGPCDVELHVGGESASCVGYGHLRVMQGHIVQEHQSVCREEPLSPVHAHVQHIGGRDRKAMYKDQTFCLRSSISTTHLELSKSSVTQKLPSAGLHHGSPFHARSTRLLAVHLRRRLSSRYSR